MDDGIRVSMVFQAVRLIHGQWSVAMLDNGSRKRSRSWMARTLVLLKLL